MMHDALINSTALPKTLPVEDGWQGHRYTLPCFCSLMLRCFVPETSPGTSHSFPIVYLTDIVRHVVIVILLPYRMARCPKTYTLGA